MEVLTRRPTTVEIAEVLRLAPNDVPWSHEGRVRAIIRRTLCMEGEAWAPADRLARRLVARGRSEANIRMPAGWDSPNDLASWTELRACDICDRHFVPRIRAQLYCSVRCKWRAARIFERSVSLRRCANCNATFESDQPQKEFCGAACRRAAKSAREQAQVRETREGRTCELCGTPLGEELRAGSRYCGKDCGKRAWYLAHNTHRKHRNGNGALVNGHDHHAEDGGARGAKPARHPPCDPSCDPEPFVSLDRVALRS